MEKIYIVGSGGFAREVAWLIEDINKDLPKYQIVGFIDEDIKNIGKEINGYKVLGNIEYLNTINQISSVVIAIGNVEVRKNIHQKIKNKIFPSLIHPSVKKSSYIKYGDGVIICAGNILTTNIIIDDFVIINLSCTIGHDTIIEKYSTVLPGVNVSGNVKIEEGASLGTGTAIIQGINIGKYSIVGAGATVTRDIPEFCTAIGSPAKPIKFHDKF